MRKLEKDIRRHQKLYYVKNQPKISDREFDKLFFELQELEMQYPELTSPDSPIRVVGSDLDNSFEKITHLVPVLSLGNTYSSDQALKWATKLLNDFKSDILVQWKIDGATLVLYYKSGRLARALTRGSGQVGDDVTANALTIRNIPHVLTEPVDVVVRGEAYMTFSDFQRFNEDYGSIYANPRNLTSGSLKHKKSRDVALRPIMWSAFECHFIDTTKILPNDFKQTVSSLSAKTRAKKTDFKNDSQALEYLEKLGLPIAPDTIQTSADKIESVIDSFTKKKLDTGFPVDGLVLKLNDLSARKKSGFTAHSPRWAVSLKFEPEVASTKILDVEFFTGRTGRVTPRARLDPVVLAGTTVSYATLHNADYIDKLGVRIGALVKVSKRGEIIPAVEEVVDPGKGPGLKFPKKCPGCQSLLIRQKDAADWVCENPDCVSKKLENIIFFCQRKQMDIAGMGERTCKALYEEKLVTDISEIYKLKKFQDKIEVLDGFGKKSARLILDGIENSKKKPYARVLASLGLKEIGHSVTDILINAGFDSINSLLRLVKKKNALEKLQVIDGIGPQTAQAIVTQLTDQKILQLISELKKSGLQFEQKKSRSDQPELKQIFLDQSWCVTGSFEAFSPRDLAKDEIKKRGGRVVTTVSAKTTHLLAGDKAGSKLAKANDLGVRVVSEKEFIEWIK